MSNLFGPDSSLEGAAIAAYERCGVTLDALPYTTVLDSMVVSLRSSFKDITHAELLHTLFNARKAKRLPATGLEGEPAPLLTDTQQRVLAKAVVAVIGSIGARDQLPHTKKFDQVHEAFFAESGLNLEPHNLWRAISNLSKASSDRPIKRSDTH